MTLSLVLEITRVTFKIGACTCTSAGSRAASNASTGISVCAASGTEQVDAPEPEQAVSSAPCIAVRTRVINDAHGDGQ